ncbi:MAG: hypothetical protein PUP90_05990 [Nostoc sp. S4]|nr:hypothetical protein [Nostoc sp. S4]
MDIYSRRQEAEGSYTEGKTITIPSFHACHYVLKGVTTAVRKKLDGGQLFIEPLVDGLPLTNGRIV